MKTDKVETRLDILEKEMKALKVEVATLRLYIERRHPVVKEELDKVRKEVMEEMGAAGKKRAAA